MTPEEARSLGRIESKLDAALDSLKKHDTEIDNISKRLNVYSGVFAACLFALGFLKAHILSFIQGNA